MVPERQDESLAQHQPLLTMFGGLLSMVLAADLARTELEREREKISAQAHTDQLTGLLNRRGWDRAVASEEARFQRFGDPGAAT